MPNKVFNEIAENKGIEFVELIKFNLICLIKICISCVLIKL